VDAVLRTVEESPLPDMAKEMLREVFQNGGFRPGSREQFNGNGQAES
jgi:hypothetical protein